MGYEIDYIPAEEGEKSGDAISLRFGNLFSSRDEQTVVVIDGGFKNSGEKLVEHIKKYYNTDIIDIVISTHPDEDHSEGLSVVLEKCKVLNLLMHKPWEHAEDIKNLFKSGRITTSGLENKLEKSLQNIKMLEEIAAIKGIPIFEPFQGGQGLSGALHVLSPSEEYYKTLLPLFKSTPTPKNSISEIMKRVFEKDITWIDDSADDDLLDDNEDTTSPKNNTSTVVLLNIDGKKFLFTGDVGKTGLLAAVDYAESLKITLTDLNFLDVPHHGSKRNISSKVLSKIKASTAFISAAKDSIKHPAKKVTNALKKQKTEVFVNRGRTIFHFNDAPDREGWRKIQEEPFYYKVEE